MGLFEKIFKNQKINSAMNGYFKTFSAYTPVFTSRSGGLYEMDSTRAAIHATATHCSKLKPHVTGSANKRMERVMQFRPNPWQTTSQFLYRLATILEVDNTAFLVPLLDEYDRTSGVYPVRPSQCSVMEGSDGKAYLRYEFQTGKHVAIEYERCGVMIKMQYKDDFFGESNHALNPTLDLMSAQNQGIQEGIKSAAALRFMAKLGNSIRDEDLRKEQKRFKELNLSADNNGGVMIYDAKYAEVKQIDSKPYVVDADQMKIINDSVYNYFGVNEKILRNEWDEQTWNAFYEGKIEPFALQLSLVMTSMLFSEREIAAGNEITFSANRLQFASTAVKLETVRSLFDRGMLNQNEAREIFQMPGLGPEGEKYYVLAEYVPSAQAGTKQLKEGKENGQRDKSV